MKKILFLLSCFLISSMHGMRICDKVFCDLSKRFVPLHDYKTCGVNFGKLPRGPYQHHRLMLGIGVSKGNCSDLFELHKHFNNTGRHVKWKPAVKEFIDNYEPLSKKYPEYHHGRIIPCLVGILDDDAQFRGWVAKYTKDGKPFELLVNSLDIAFEDQKYVELMETEALKAMYEHYNYSKK